MKILNLAAFSLLTLGVISACKPGFTLEDEDPVDEENADRTFHGSNEVASWTLLLDYDTGAFTLENRNNPGSAVENYTVTGNFDTDNDGWFEFNASSDLDDEVIDDTFYGVEIADHAIIIEPFTNVDNEWVPLVATSGCPSANIGGMAIMLNQPSTVTAADRTWISDFDYNLDDEEFEYSNGVALDASFTVQETFFQESDDCSDGYVQRSAGDQYFGDTATLVELDDDVAVDGYTRALSLPSQSTDTITEIDGNDYIGFIRDFAEDDNSYRVNADCSSGVCDIFSVSGSDMLTLSISETDINYDDIDGIAIGTLSDPTGTFGSTRAVCMLHGDIDPSSTDDEAEKLVLCTAQSLSNNEAALQILLSVIVEDVDDN